MSVKVIEIVQLLVDRVHQNGYQHRALEDDIYAEKEKRAAVEKDRDHWKTARQEAIEAGELMKAEIESLRQQLTAAEAAVSLQRAGIERLNAFVGRARELLRIPLAKITYDEMAIVRAELAALDAETSEAEGGQ